MHKKKENILWGNNQNVINYNMKKLYCVIVLLLILIAFKSLMTGEKDKKESIVNQNTYSTFLIEEIKEPLKQKEEIVQKEPELTKEEELQQKLNKIKCDNIKEWFIAYKDLVFKYAKWVEVPKTVFDAFTEEEVRLMCQMIETECYQRDFESKVNVANVAFNRLDSGEFGDTIKEVITMPNQFSYWRTTLAEDTILALQYAFEMEDTTQGALYFHGNKKTETFCKRKWIFSDSAIHHFY